MKHLILIVFLIITSLSFYGQCEEVQSKTDRFTDEKITTTPSIIKTEKGASVGNGQVVVKNKVVMPATLHLSSKPDSSFLLLTVKGKYSSLPSQGAYLIFSNGEKWQRPDARVIEQTIGDYYMYLSYIYLKESDIELLKTQNITDVRVNIYDCELSEWLGNKLREQVNCAIEVHNRL